MIQTNRLKAELQTHLSATEIRFEGAENEKSGDAGDITKMDGRTCYRRG
jgi:hypothetical protein